MLWVFHSEPFDFGVDGGGRRPAAVAVPLEDVDFAAGIVITQPPGGPGAGGQAVEFDPGFPDVADASAPVAGQPAAVEGGTVFRGADDEVGVAIQEHVLAIVAVLPDVLGQLPIRRIFHRLTGSRHVPLRAVGGRAGGAVEFVLENVAGH